MRKSSMVLATLVAVTTTPGTSAETEQPQMPRVIIMNDGGTAYRTYCAPERPTAADLAVMVDIFARGGVDTLTQTLHARWQAYYDSKVVEIAVAMVEALFGYRELPNPTRPGSLPHGR